MKTTLLIPVLFLIHFEGNSQKITVTVSAAVEAPVSQDFNKVENGYLSYRVNKRKQRLTTMFSSVNFSKYLFDITLVKYDESMKIVKENDLSGTQMRFAPFEPNIDQINNKPYLVYYEPLENDDAIMLKAVEVDQATVSVSSPKELCKIQINKKAGLLKFMDIIERKKLRITVSPDTSKILFLFENGIDNSFIFTVTDKDLKVLWTKNNLIDIPEDIVITSACVDNAGNVYTAYKIESRKNGVKGHVLICSQSKKEKDISISEDDEMYQILVLPPKKQNGLSVVGTCFGGTQYVNAVFSATINLSNFKIVNFKRTDLSEKFIDLFDQEGLAYTKKNKYGLHPSHMKAYELDDESIGMVGEIKKVKTTVATHQNASGNYSSNSSTTITSGSILNVCFKKDKVIFSRVPKIREVHQASGVPPSGFVPDVFFSDLRFSSFTAGDGIYALPFKNNIIIFYSDNENNLKQELTDMPSSSDKVRKLVLVAATISNEGQVNREMLIDLKDEDLLAFPAGIKYLSATSLLVPIRKVSKNGNVKNDFRWGQLAIN